MRLAEMMIVASWSSLGVVFPWYMWILAVLDVLFRIADDYKEWLKEKRIAMIEENLELERKKNALLNEIKNLENIKNMKNMKGE